MDTDLDVAVVGELNVDVILERLNARPELEAERIAEDSTFTMGSSSAILSANASALGLSVGFVGVVGADPFGDYMREGLAERGVETGQIVVSPTASTGLTVIYTYGSERGMLTDPGAMEELTLAHVSEQFLERADHLHLSSYYLHTALRADCPELYRRARELGLSTSFDTNPDPDDEWGPEVLEVLDHVDVFLPNDREARRIAGTDDLRAALAQLAERADTVVATRGAEGVLACTRDRFVELPGLPVDPVDAVGAGDSFNAGFLRRHLAGAELEEALAFGSIAAAYSTQSAGGTSAFDEMDGFDAFADRMRRTLEVTASPR